MADDFSQKARSLRADLEELLVAYIAKDGAHQTNAEISRALDLESSFQGGQRNYLCHALLSGLAERGRLVRYKDGNLVRYKI